MMTRITSILILLALAVALPARAQRERNVIYQVGVGELIYTPPAPEGSTAGQVLKSVAQAVLTGQTSSEQPQYAEAVRTALLGGLSKVLPFRLHDGTVSPAQLPADTPALYADGTITTISTVQKSETRKDSKGKTYVDTYYRGLVAVTVNLKDAHDGTVVDSHTFSVADGGGVWLASGEKAIADALGHITRQAAEHYGKLFPLYASIVEGVEAKKDKQKEVYIDLGAADGVSKGMQFDVFTVRTVAGRQAQSVIGRLKIEEVAGDDISLCKVTKGGDKIKAAIDAGATLVIASR